MGILSLILSALFIRTIADLTFKYAVNHVNFDSFDSVVPNIIRIITRPIIWIALSLALLNFWLWCLVLAQMDLSFAYPLFSFCYVLIMISGKFLFGEHLDKYKIIGLIAICIGSALLLLG